MTISTGTDPKHVRGETVSASLFSLLGVQPAIGRTFTEDEEKSQHLVVLSDHFWRERFRAEPNVVARMVALNGTAFTLASMDPEAALYDLGSMDDHLALNLGLSRFQSMLLELFAGIALLLTAVGLYGVMAYTVGQRVHEIGVRQALGATRAQVLWLVLGRGMGLTISGIGVGIAGALGIGHLLESLLYKVSPGDPLSFAGASLVLVIVGLLASYFPAVRATRVDPLVVLRYQ